MRLIKRQTTNARSITGKGYKYNPKNDIASVDANALRIPVGTSATRPTVPVNGYMRYNTDVNSFEFYQANTWQVVRYKEPGLITQQNLGPGNGTFLFFGPLDSNDLDFPVPNAAQNILVFVENVFQIANTNYVMTLDPASSLGATIDVFYLQDGIDYIIVTINDTDFTKVGASGNAVGVKFTANLSISATFLTESVDLFQTNKQYGASVSIQNKAVEPLYIVGAYKSDDILNSTQYTETGRAYVYNFAGSIAYILQNPNDFGGGNNDWFGWDVEISNTYIAVSAYQEDSSIDLGVGDNNGKVYLYNLASLNSYQITDPGGGGGQSSGSVETYYGLTPNTVLEIPNPSAVGDSQDWFGYSIGMTDTHLVVGAPKEEEDVNEPSGKVFLYNLSNTTTPIEINNPTNYQGGGRWFGSAVDISDNYIIVGTWPVEGSDYQNQVFIFNLAGDHLYSLENPNAIDSADDGFGHSVAINNKFAVVGAHSEDKDGVLNTGAIYIYELNDLDPTEPIVLTPKFFENPDWDGVDPDTEYRNDQYGALINQSSYGSATNDFFGWKVSLSDAYAAVSSLSEAGVNPLDPQILDQNVGIVYIYDLLTGERLLTFPNNPNDFTPADDFYGSDIYISNYHIVIGAPGAGDDLGKATVWNVEGKALGSGQVRRAGYYLEFDTPPDTGKPITVLHNFDK